MANPVTVMMNDGRRVEFSDAAALGRFAASRAFSEGRDGRPDRY